MLNDLLKALLETLYMTFVPLCIAYVIAIPLSFVCVETAKDGLYPNRIIHKMCDGVIAIELLVEAITQENIRDFIKNTFGASVIPLF